MKYVSTAVLVAALAPAGLPAQTLTPPDGRVTDRAIQADHASYEQLQSRIRGLNDRGRRASDYTLAKAQCWLDASFHEYTRNDRGDFPRAALAESEQLIALMELDAAPLPTETRLVAGAPRLRDDLWARTHALKQSRGFSCAAQRTACAEVELVHAGNEDRQQGWRHARPYLQIAEDGIAAAEDEARRCAAR